MIESLKRYWWVPVIRRICGIIFGVRLRSLRSTLAPL